MKVIQSRWVVFKARGHENVKATHKTTLEITTEDWLTPRGDCIIGVSSEIGASSFPGWFKKLARYPDSIIVFVFCSGRVCDGVVGAGDPRLSFTDSERIILRRSSYVDGKTVMVKASKAARDLRRDLVELLKKGGDLTVYATVIPGNPS